MRVLGQSALRGLGPPQPTAGPDAPVSFGALAERRSLATRRSSGLHVMKLAPSSPATRMFEASRRRALDVGLLTWNINGNPLSAEDAKAWAECAGPADAYFVAIQALALRRGALVLSRLQRSDL